MVKGINIMFVIFNLLLLKNGVEFGLYVSKVFKLCNSVVFIFFWVFLFCFNSKL